MRLLLVLLLAGCGVTHPAPDVYDGVQRCVAAPLGTNANGGLVMLMRCQVEGEGV